MLWGGGCVGEVFYVKDEGREIKRDESNLKEREMVYNRRGRLRDENYEVKMGVCMYVCMCLG